MESPSKDYTEEEDEDDDNLSAKESYSTGSLPREVEEVSGTSNSCWPCRCCSARAIKRIRDFSAKFKDNAAPLLTLMEWRRFPSDRQKRSRGQNYLVCKVWVLTYALLEVKEIENQTKLKESPAAERFAELLGTAELMGTELTKYGALLLQVKRLYHEAIALPIQRDTDEMPAELIKLRFDVNPYLILGGKLETKEDFIPIRAGVRDLQVRQWSNFSERKDGFYLVSTGLLELITDCSRITKNLKNLQETLRNSMSFWTRKISIRPTLRWIRRLNKRVDNGKQPSSDEVVIYEEALDLFEHLLYYGDLIVLEAMKLLLMIRLCYIYVKTGTVDHIFCMNLDSYAKVLSKNYCKDLGKLIPWANFNGSDWYKIACPEALRRVPVLISDKYELGLFHEDYQRARRKLSKAQARSIANLLTLRIKEDTTRMHNENGSGHKPKHLHRNTKFSFNLRRLGSGRASRPYGLAPGSPRPSESPAAKV